MPLTSRQMKKLYSEIAITVAILVVILAMGVLMYKNKVNTLKIEELKREAYTDNIKDSILVDSLKFKMLQDSLYIVDLQRIKQISNLNTQDKHDKASHNLVIAVIPTADDKQRDRIWSTYSPKD